jgi:hypothetical protein
LRSVAAHGDQGEGARNDFCAARLVPRPLTSGFFRLIRTFGDNAKKSG